MHVVLVGSVRRLPSLVILLAVVVMRGGFTLGFSTSLALRRTRVSLSRLHALPTDKLEKTLKYYELDSVLVDTVLQAADKAIKPTDFLRPPEYDAVLRAFDPLVDVKALSTGGYALSERKRICFMREELAAPVNDTNFIAAISVQGNFLFDKATHRDFLGAIMGTGIKREKVGDIIVTGERGAQILCVPELADYICIELKNVRTVPVECERISLQELKVRQPVTKELTSVEASLRLDAIASAGFGMSRSKMVQLIESGDVMVDWKEITSAAQSLKAGNVVSVRGNGRLTVEDVQITAKGRYRVRMVRLC